MNEHISETVQGKYVKGSREKNNKPMLTRDVLLKRKTKELGVKTSPQPSDPK